MGRFGVVQSNDGKTPIPFHKGLSEEGIKPFSNGGN
jgi:hypothetical protein